MERKKFLLSECDIPRVWYNVIADMTNKPLPLINPGTKQPLKAVCTWETPRVVSR